MKYKVISQKVELVHPQILRISRDDQAAAGKEKMTGEERMVDVVAVASSVNQSPVPQSCSDITK
uniref:Uncharacterized protein n=1 Tax=Arundo donax TaxID=35708 RepID=A0A0A9B1U1_ARUDO